MNFKDFVEPKLQRSLCIEEIIPTKVKTKKYLNGIKKGTTVTITDIGFWIKNKRYYFNVSGKSKKKFTTFHSEDFGFLEMIK